MKRTLKLEHEFPYRHDIPKRLFKVFDTQERAHDFLNGNVWFRSLTSMRNIEAPGADLSEGKPSVEHGPAKVTFSDSETGEVLAIAEATSTKIGWSTSEPEKRLISCFSNFGEAPSGSKFGDYVVEVFNPAEMIENWLAAINHLEFGQIEYFDPKEVDAIKNPQVPPWLLKEIEFADECEFRISFELGNLNEFLEFAELPENFSHSKVSKQLDGLTYSFGSNNQWARLIKSFVD